MSPSPHPRATLSYSLLLLCIPASFNDSSRASEHGVYTEVCECVCVVCETLNPKL